MYLGHVDGKPYSMSCNDLTTHGVVLGRTGSGKTGLLIALIEEAAYSGVSVVVLDPKGDLTNLGLSLISRDEFADWHAQPENTRLEHGEGLAKFDLGFEHVKHWRDSIDVKVYTPGTVGPGSVNIFPTFTPPFIKRKDKALRDVSSVLSVVAKDSDPSSPASVYLGAAVYNAWQRNETLRIDAWPGVLSRPPEDLSHFGGMSVDDFYPESQRKKLARTLVGFLAHGERWLAGARINLQHVAEINPRPQINIFSMKHLREEDRQFFAALFLNQVVEYMYETGSANYLKLLVVMDEARGYIPPHPHNPPTKAPIGTLLAQGRAQGIGLLIGTQNPMDLDYKALSNVGTWFIGKLRERDCVRDLATELEGRGVDVQRIMNIPQRRFLTIDRRGEADELDVRWCMNYLHGPIAEADLSKLQRYEWADPGRPMFSPDFLKV